MAISAAQQRYLRDKLNTARQSKPHRHADSPQLLVPFAVKEANARIKRDSKIVDRWDKKCRNARSKRSERIDKAFAMCQEELMIGGDAKKALKLIEAFDRRKF